MTGLLDRLLGWIRSLGGTGSTAATGDEVGTDGEAGADATVDEPGAGTAEGVSDSAAVDHAPDTRTGDPAHKCSVCGTPVDDPDGGCPLCGSTDVVPREGDVSAIGAETMATSATADVAATTDAESVVPTAENTAEDTAESDGALAGESGDAETADAATDDGVIDSNETAASGDDDGAQSDTHGNTVDADDSAEEGSLPSSKATEVRTGDSDDDAVSRLRELRERADEEDA